MRAGLGVTIQGAQQLQENTKAQCVQQGWKWILDPNPDPAVAKAVGDIGTCVDPAMVSSPGFDAHAYFANFTLQSPINPGVTVSASLPIKAVNPTPPDVTSPVVVREPVSEQFLCNDFDQFVDQHRFVALAALVGIFALMGGFR